MIHLPSSPLRILSPVLMVQHSGEGKSESGRMRICLNLASYIIFSVTPPPPLLREKSPIMSDKKLRIRESSVQCPQSQLCSDAAVELGQVFTGRQIAFAEAAVVSGRQEERGSGSYLHRAAPLVLMRVLAALDDDCARQHLPSNRIWNAAKGERRRRARARSQRGDRLPEWLRQSQSSTGSERGGGTRGRGERGAQGRRQRPSAHWSRTAGAGGSGWSGRRDAR
jgi:hypothetical protein